MNTTLKGDVFEDLCFGIISEKLNECQLGVIPSLSKVYQRKGYYSRDREKDIVFDLSIEVTLPDADTYSLLYIIECKNYSKNVPVDDLEEFYAKINQVAGANLKGVFITNQGFSSGAYTFARSKGIMLIQVNSNLTFNIILHKTYASTENRIVDKFLLKHNIDFNNPIDRIAIIRKWKLIIQNRILTGFINYLKSTGIIQKSDLPRLTGNQVDEIAMEILKEFDPRILSTGKKLNLDELTLYFHRVLRFNFKFVDSLGIDAHGRKIFAQTDFLNKEVKFLLEVKGSARYGFMLAHEIGHVVLHNKLSISQEFYESFSDHKFSYRLKRGDFSNERHALEWQANRFASSLLMPEIVFRLACRIVFKKRGRREFEPLYVDNTKHSQDDFHYITGYLALYFNTTKTSVIYRMSQFNLLNNKSSLTHISEIINKEFSYLFDN